MTRTDRPARPHRTITTLREAHRRSSEEWILRMERAASGPRAA